MTARQIELFLIGCCIVAALILAITALLPSPASAHGTYTGKKDPVTNRLCCGGQDCAVFRVIDAEFTPVADGYHIKMTEAQARKINPQRVGAIEFTVPWNRVQDSWDGNFHLCIPTVSGYWTTSENAFYCFWAPPST